MHAEISLWFLHDPWCVQQNNILKRNSSDLKMIICGGMHYYILHGGEISQNRNQISTNKYQAKEDTLLLKSNMLHTCSFMRWTRFSTVTLTFDQNIGQVELSWVHDVISHLICIFIDFFKMSPELMHINGKLHLYLFFLFMAFYIIHLNNQIICHWNMQIVFYVLQI